MLLLAQKSTFGTIVDEANKPVSNLQISVRGSTVTTTDYNGRFKFELAQPNRPLQVSDIRIYDPRRRNLKIKEIKTSPRLVILMQPATILRGVLVHHDKQALANNKIVLLGQNDQKPVVTDANGRFEIQLSPQTQVGSNSHFQVNGNPIPPGQVMFKQNATSVIIRLEPSSTSPQPSTYLISVRNRQGQPVPNASLRISGQSYRANGQGDLKISPEVLSGDSAVQVQGYRILQSDFKEGENRFTFQVEEQGTKATQSPVKVPLPNANQPSIQDDINKITEELREDREEQITRSARFQRELRQLSNRLLNKANFTPQQRNALHGYVSELTQTFHENDSLFEQLRQESRLELSALESIIFQKDSLRLVAEQKVKEVESEKQQIQEEKERAESRFRDNLIILSTIIVLLLILATTFFLYNRVIKKQKSEIEITKDQLAEKVEEIHQQNEEIKVQRDSLSQKTKELERTYNQIRSSIYSAERIQNAILDKPQEIMRHVNDGFIFFAPRDIVSGDFYWYSHKGAETIIAAVDCTGHGVPGAFMTMLGNSLLNQIVNENYITEPSEILTLLDAKVQETLHQQERDTSHDGMDMTLININRYTQKVIFAGAKNPLYYVKNNVLHQIKGTNIPIGSTKFKKNHQFKSHEIEIEGGEVFYLQSDGFQDQFGGEVKNRKKYMKTRYKDFLLEISSLPLSEQCQALEKEFRTWKGENSQTDDVLVMGIKL